MLKEKIYKLLASGLGVGYVKLFPGGGGTVEGFFLSWFLYSFTPCLRFLISFIIILSSFFIADRAEKIYNQKDPSQIVIDEIVGMLIASLFVFNLKETISIFFLKVPLMLVLICLLFLVFDFFKPFPANKAQELKGGWGVVLDDIIAGFYTGICLLLINILR